MEDQQEGDGVLTDEQQQDENKDERVDDDDDDDDVVENHDASDHEDHIDENALEPELVRLHDHDDSSYMSHSLPDAPDSEELPSGLDLSNNADDNHEAETSTGQSDNIELSPGDEQKLSEEQEQDDLAAQDESQREEEELEDSGNLGDLSLDNQVAQFEELQRIAEDDEEQEDQKGKDEINESRENVADPEEQPEGEEESETKPEAEEGAEADKPINELETESPTENTENLPEELNEAEFSVGTMNDMDESVVEGEGRIKSRVSRSSSKRSRISEASRSGEEEERGESEAGEIVQRPTREELLEKYQQALLERHQIQVQNSSLQHRLSDCLRKKKVEDIPMDDRSVIEQEQRYLKYMAALDDLRQEERQQSEEYRCRMEELEEVCAVKQDEVVRQCNSLETMIKEFFLTTNSTATGKPLPSKIIESLLETQKKREAEVSRVRLINIKLKNQLNKQMSALRSQEELADGLHMIDFEQLKIENQTYNEKIEERNEELLRLKKKITRTVEVLSHVKEKLEFVERENERDRERLEQIDKQINDKRDEMSKIKRVRDRLRSENIKHRQAAGLLTNHTLLADYEQKVDDCASMIKQLLDLKKSREQLDRAISVNTLIKETQSTLTRSDRLGEVTGRSGGSLLGRSSSALVGSRHGSSIVENYYAETRKLSGHL